MEEHQRELLKEERQHEVHEEGRKTGYTAMEGQVYCNGRSA